MPSAPHRATSNSCCPLGEHSAAGVKTATADLPTGGGAASSSVCSGLAIEADAARRLCDGSHTWAL